MKDSNGELAGFEIDVARQLAQDMGVKPEFHIYEWKNIIAGLQDKKIDIILGGMTITPKRALKLNFTQPYAQSDITLATNTVMTKDLKTLKQANKKEITFTVVSGTTSSKLANSLFDQATIQEFTSPDAAAQAVVDGKAHAYIADSPQPEFLALQHPDKIDTPLNKPLRSQMAGMAINKGEQEWLNFLNSWIIAKKSDGWLQASHKYWFTTLDWKKQAVQ